MPKSTFDGLVLGTNDLLAQTRVRWACLILVGVRALAADFSLPTHEKSRWKGRCDAGLPATTVNLSDSRLCAHKAPVNGAIQAPLTGCNPQEVSSNGRRSLQLLSGLGYVT
jgi:hypothetical protein